MKIELKNIKIRDVFKNYTNNAEDGVTGYGGRLNIRPKYQREFVYGEKERNAVIDTVRKQLPLNVMYWVKSGEDAYELLDGQQRTISVCSYLSGDFSLNFRYFHNLTSDEQNQILDYELMIYICEGSDKQKLEWFKIINISGMKLTDQELRNAIYTGPWLTDAKRYFSKTNCPAYNIANDYINGKTLRQEFLETAIGWIAHKEGIEIEDYMSLHQSDTDASEIWTYFQNVINWVNVTFPKYRKEMKGIEWGEYYNLFRDKRFNPNELERKITELMQDEDITKKKGIYEYVIDGKERHLNLRAFSEKMKREAYEEQKGICPTCEEHFELDEMEADHIAPWHEGGKTIASNCRMLCVSCNRMKSGR